MASQRAGTAYVSVEGDWGKFNRQLAQQTARLRDQGKQAGQQLSKGIGDGAAKIKTAPIDKATVSTKALGDQAQKTGNQFKQAHPHVTKLTSRVGEWAKAQREAKVESDALTGSMVGLTGAAGASGEKVSGFSRAMGELKWPGAIVAIGSLTAAMNAAAGGAVALTSAIAPASGALAALPAAASAGVQAMGTLKLATAGLKEGVGDLNEPLDETSKAFKRLTPEAQEFARFLHEGVGPVIVDLQKTAQRGFFPGAQRGLSALGRNTQVFQRIVGSTARELGRLAERGGRMLGGKAWGSDLAKQGARNEVTIRRMGQVAFNLANALRHITMAAGPLVNWMTRLTVRGSEWIEQQAAFGRSSGKTAAFLERTTEVMSQLGRMARNLGVAFLEIGKAAAPLGREILEDLEKLTKRFAEWTKSAEGHHHMAEYFHQIKAPLYAVAHLMGTLGKAFFHVGAESQGTLTLMIQKIDKLVPSVAKLVEHTTAAFGPHFIDFMYQFLRLITNLAGENGPIIIMTDTLALFNRVLANILESSPALKVFVHTMIGLVAVIKVFSVLRVVTGLALLTRSWKAVRASALGAAAAQRVAAAAGLVGPGGAAKTTAKTAAAAGGGQAVANQFLAGGAGATAASKAGGVAGNAWVTRFVKVAKFGLARLAIPITIVLATLNLPKITKQIQGALGSIGVPKWATNTYGFIQKWVSPLGQAKQRLDAIAGSFKFLDNIGGGGGSKLGGLTKRILDAAEASKKLQVRSDSVRQALQGVAKGALKTAQDTRHMNKSAVDNAVASFKQRVEQGKLGKETEALRRDFARLTREQAQNRKETRQVTHIKNLGRTVRALQEDIKGLGKNSSEYRIKAELLRRKQKQLNDHLDDASPKARRAARSMKGMTDEGYALRSSVDKAGDWVRRLNKHLLNSSAESRNTRGAFKTLRDNAKGLGERFFTTGSIIKEVTDKVLSSLGAEPLKWALTGAKKLLKARGGFIGKPGERGGDTVQTVLPADWAVINRHQLAAMGFARGGMVPVAVGRGEYAAPPEQLPYFDGAARRAGYGGLGDVFRKVNRPHYLARGGMVRVPGDPNDTGGRDRVNSAIAQQVGQWVRAYKLNIGYAYDPGHHQSPGHNVTGTALDVYPGPGGNWDLLEKGLRAAIKTGKKVLYGTNGVGTPYPNHGRNNHAHVEWGMGGSVAGLVDEIGRIVVKGGTTATRRILQAGADKMRRAANRKIASVVPDAQSSGTFSALPGGGTPGKNRALGRKMLGNDAHWPALRTLWEGESGWNQYARNPGSGAYGIPQSLPASKMGPEANPPKSNPGAQIAWGLNYIRGRYGSPTRALAAWRSRSPHWYARGGFVGAARGLLPRVKRSPTVRTAKASKRYPKVNVLDPNYVDLTTTNWWRQLGDLTKSWDTLTGAGGTLWHAEDDYSNTEATFGLTQEELLLTNNETTPISVPWLPGQLIQPGQQYVNKPDQDRAANEFRELIRQKSIIAVMKEKAADIAQKASTFATAIYKRVNQMLKHRRDSVANRIKKLTRLNNHLVDLKNALEKARKRKPKTAAGKRDQAKEIRDRTQDIAQTRSDIRGTKSELVALTGDETGASDGGIIEKLTTESGNAKDAMDTFASSLYELPSEIRTLRTIDLPTLENALTDVLGTVAEKFTPPESDATRDDSELVALLQEQVRESNLRTAVALAQYDVFRNFPPFGGSFAEGGVVPGPAGAARTVIAHGGETIANDSDAGHVRVVVEDRRVRVFYDDVEQIVQQVTRNQARSGARVLPGRGGGNW